MQKVINAMAIVSFGINVGMIAGGLYLYQNKDNIVNDVREKITTEITEMIPGMLGGLTPEVPEVPSAQLPKF